MLYWLTEFSDGGDVFNLFRYITFRAGMAFATALIFGFMFGRPLIDLLRRRQGKGQSIRDDGPQSHLAKAGTPTMGGLLILSALMPYLAMASATLDIGTVPSSASALSAATPLAPCSRIPSRAIALARRSASSPILKQHLPHPQPQCSVVADWN